ncbi:MULTISPECIES: hypothetical protein [unclassified Luteococcus]|uniref:hypothetical protein n=1 Tax=unclassified Luteococcus TaxID=2639923 RepID=UPI00313AFEE4
MTRMRQLPFVIAVAMAATGCTTDSPTNAIEAPATQQSVAGEVSQSQFHPNLRSLAKASTLVVIAEPTQQTRIVDADEDGVTGEKSTLSTMRVTSVLKGRQLVHAGDTIELRQFGAPTDPTVPEELVRSGNDYLLYLSEFRFHPNQTTGQWTGTSMDAFYARKHGEKDFQNRSIHGIGQLGKTVTAGQAEAALS